MRRSCLSAWFAIFPKQSVEERRYLGPVFHGPYVPLRSEPSASVTAREIAEQALNQERCFASIYLMEENKKRPRWFPIEVKIVAY